MRQGQNDLTVLLGSMFNYSKASLCTSINFKDFAHNSKILKVQKLLHLDE